jgi:hypothetical protein
MTKHLLLAALAPLLLAPTAQADTGFYDNPAPPGTAGDVVRTEPSRLVLEPSGVVQGWAATGTRVMYWTAGTP